MKISIQIDKLLNRIFLILFCRHILDKIVNVLFGLYCLLTAGLLFSVVFGCMESGLRISLVFIFLLYYSFLSLFYPCVIKDGLHFFLYFYFL